MKRTQRGYATFEFLIGMLLLAIPLGAITGTVFAVFQGLFQGFQLYDIPPFYAGLAALLGTGAISALLFGLIPGLIAALWGYLACIRKQQFRSLRDILQEYYCLSLFLLCAVPLVILLINGACSLLFDLFCALRMDQRLLL